MKRLTLSCLLAISLAAPAQAVFYSFNSSTLNTTIPDANLSGIQNSLNVSGFDGGLLDVNVRLNISNGFNGDYYAFLTHGTSTAILLNRVGLSNSNGVGYNNTGFNVTLDDQAGQDVHFYRNFSFTLNGNGQLIGGWQPDGRFIDPLSAGSAFPGATRGNMLGLFNGSDPNGMWTLFVADVSGGSQGMLVNWGLDITAVPEPGAVTLLCLLGGGLFWKSMSRRDKRSTLNAQRSTLK